MPIASLALLASLSPAQETPPVVPSEMSRCVDYLVTDLLEHEGVPALTLCIRVDGKVLVASSRGWSDEGHGTAVTDATRFPIGSLSRVFNAAAIAQLIEKGELALDDDVMTRLPGSIELAQRVRLRQVLEGTSGIAPWSGVFSAAGKKAEAGLEPEAMLALFKTAPFEFAPGAEYAPNSAAWSLLPLVLERAWGAPYARGMRDRLFAPLGLTHMGVDPLDTSAMDLIQDCEAVASAHDLELVLAQSSPKSMPSLRGTAGDLATWMEALGMGRVVGPELLATMTTSAKKGKDKPTGHGYALDLDELVQHPRWWHSGGIGGFRARMAWYPDDKLAVAVLANCKTANLDALESELARFVIGLPATRRLDLPLTAAESARFVGGYQIATTRVRISARGTHLLWQGPETERECAWQGRTRFVDVKDADFVVRFEIEGERATAFELHRGDNTTRGMRVE